MDNIELYKAISSMKEGEHGLFFVSRVKGSYLMATCVQDTKVHTYIGCMPYGHLLENYIWQDGNPCGILENE